MVVALKTGFFFFDPATEKFTAIVEPEPDLPHNRFNDGKTDRQGRFWAGTLYDPDESKATGGLYRLNTDLTCTRMVDRIYASNGLAFRRRGEHPGVAVGDIAADQSTHVFIVRRRLNMNSPDLRPVEDAIGQPMLQIAEAGSVL